MNKEEIDNKVAIEIEGETWLTPDEALFEFRYAYQSSLGKLRKEGLPYRDSNGPGNTQYEYPLKLCQAWFRCEFIRIEEVLGNA